MLLTLIDNFQITLSIQTLVKNSVKAAPVSTEKQILLMFDGTKTAHRRRLGGFKTLLATDNIEL